MFQQRIQLQSLILNISFYSSLGFWHPLDCRCLYCQEFCGFLLLYDGLLLLLQQLRLNTHRASLARTQPAGSRYFPLFGTPEVSCRTQEEVLSPTVQDGCQQTGHCPSTGTVGRLEHIIYTERQKPGFSREKRAKVGSNFSLPFSKGFKPRRRSHILVGDVQERNRRQQP